MPNVPYKYLKDEHNTTFYPIVGPSSFNDALPISKGGTGATTAMDARKNLGVAGGTIYFKDQVVSAATNAEILRITDSSITSDTIVVESVWYGPVTITSWTSYDGYIAFNGTCTTATTADITLSIVDVPAQSAPLSITKGGTGANNAEDALVNLGVEEFVSASRSSNYIKFPNGTLIQWAVNSYTASGSMAQVGTSGIYVGYVDVAFPVPFYDEVIVVSGYSKYSTGHARPIAAQGFSVSNNVVTGMNCAVEDFFARPLNDGLLVIRWVAIGRWKA